MEKQDLSRMKRAYMKYYKVKQAWMEDGLSMPVFVFSQESVPYETKKEMPV